MKISGRVFICLCSVRLLFSSVWCSPSLNNEGDLQSLQALKVEAAELPPVLLHPPEAKNSHDLLLPLVKLLSRPSPQRLEDSAPRPQIDSRALRYMKRLYRMFATKEGIPKINTNHLYNTVRLFTPHAECKHPAKDQMAGDLHSGYLLFNLDCVTAVEHLLKSVLLYSFDKPVSKSLSVTCSCHLVVKERISNHECPNTAQAMTSNVQFELRRKWIEIDVTPFLQPLIISDKKSIHVAVNFTCLQDSIASRSEEVYLNMALLSPSLLLYLNDTSEQAYHRWNLLKQARQKSVWSRMERGLLIDPNETAGKDFSQGKRPTRNRRDGHGTVENTPALIYNFSQYYKQFLFPQNECELHNFWLKFSQLKWDRWIIAPHRYNPHYCKGECPRAVGHRYGSPVHTMVQNIIHEKLDSSVPKPSCVPAEYSPLSVLKIESDKSIVYKEYEDMIATKCTCR